MAVKRNIRLAVNADNEFTFRWKDSTGIPYILSDVVMTVKENEATDDVIVEASVDNGYVIIDTDPDVAYAYIVIPKAALAGQTTKKAQYDIIATRQVDGRSLRIYEGDVVISKGISA